MNPPIENGTQMISTVDSSIVGIYDNRPGNWTLPTVLYKNDAGELQSIRYKESEWRIR